MAASKHLAIRAAAAAALASMTLDGSLHLNRDLSLATGRHKSVHLNFLGTEPVDVVVYTDHPRDWNSEFELIVLARKFGGIEACDVADSIWVDAYSLLMADQSLGGLVEELVPGSVTVTDAEGDTSLCRLTWTFTAKHRTTNNSIS